MGDVNRSALETLSARDTEAFAQLVQRESLSHVRATSTKQTVHLDLDEGILKALNDHCTAEQIEPATLVVVDRTVEQPRGLYTQSSQLLQLVVRLRKSLKSSCSCSIAPISKSGRPL